MFRCLNLMYVAVESTIMNVLGVSMKNIFLFLALVIFATFSYAEEKKPAVKMETATFAAGCFWGVEEHFRKLPGVMSTEVGYTGGTTANPKYDEMHDGHTGHAESVKIEFDPTKISYQALLDQFFKMHDPTTKDRQGNDTGTQYRSAIFYNNEEQKKEAMAFKEKVEKSGAWKAPIVTEVAEAKKFWPAEDYHQKYLIKHPGGYDNHYMRKISFDTPTTKK
jgi:methionine-S-sulfoxide reductase